AADDQVAAGDDLGGTSEAGLRLRVQVDDRGGRRRDGGVRAEGDVAAADGRVVDDQLRDGVAVVRGGREELDRSIGTEQEGVDEDAVDVDEGGDDAQVDAREEGVAGHVD